MVKHSSGLDAIFGALADGTRRGILERLAGGQTRVTDLAEPFRISLPAVSRHLRVLEHAGMITRDRVGREHRIAVDPAPLRKAGEWIATYREVWEYQFDRLESYLRSVDPTP